MTINQNYYSQTLIVQCMKLKPKISTKILAAIKKSLISLIIQLSQYYDNSSKSVIGKMKDEPEALQQKNFLD